MPETLGCWEGLVQAEDRALDAGQEEVAASLAEERLRLLEAALARGESLPLAAMAAAQERLRTKAEARRRELEAALLEARQQGRRASGYRAGAGLVLGQAVAVDRRS